MAGLLEAETAHLLELYLVNWWAWLSESPTACPLERWLVDRMGLPTV